MYMNKVLVFSTVISAALMILAACSKETSQPPVLTGEAFIQSDTVVKRGQAIGVRFTDSSSLEDLAVAPNKGVKIFAADKSASILFTQPGLFTITAKAGSSGQVFIDTVRVVDSVYTPPVNPYPMDLAAEDVITLEPISFQDNVLVFHARGKISYSCWAALLYQNNSTSAAVKIDFTGVPNPASILCMPAPWPAPFAFVYTQGYANGTHSITIRLGRNLTTYTGTLTVTDDKYVFNWPDNIPVVITPKEIARVK